jgi:HlyD family secretion protein
MKRKWIIILAVVLVVATGLFLFFKKRAGSEQKYQTTTVTRGDLKATVTSTGTIAAVGTVQVGTQVSGTVEEVLVDYNSEVHKGQLLARLDTRVLQAAVDDAMANLDKAQAQYAAALDQYNRNKPLFDKKYISAIEFNQYRSALDAGRASVTSAQVALQRARTNYGYAEIRSPTDGTVIQRTVEPGQTVAASLSTPTLFTIAQDLSHMQIEASVDESDIGQIQEGQQVTFSVQSHPEKTFKGIAKQIRLQPTTVQNVVNYTVVIDAQNENGLLLPGMTATVNFEVNKVTDVYVVPNAALRFQPSADVLDELRKSGKIDSATASGGRTRTRTGGAGATGAANSGAGTANGGAGAANGGASAGTAGATGGGGRDSSRASGTSRSRGRIWTLDNTGALKMISVRVGLSDGQKTEISGPGVTEGMVVVTSVAAPAATGTTNRTGTGLPFGTPGAGTGGRQGGGGGGRGGF